MSIQIIANQNLRETLFCMPNEVSRKIPTIRAIYKSVDKDDIDYINQQQLQSQRLQLFLYSEKIQGMNLGQMKSLELSKPLHKLEKYFYNIKYQEQNNQKVKAKQVEKQKQQEVYEITDCSENEILNEQNGELEQNQNQVYYLSQTNSDQYDLSNPNDNNILCTKISVSKKIKKQKPEEHQQKNISILNNKILLNQLLLQNKFHQPFQINQDRLKQQNNFEPTKQTLQNNDSYKTKQKGTNYSKTSILVKKDSKGNIQFHCNMKSQCKYKSDKKRLLLQHQRRQHKASKIFKGDHICQQCGAAFLISNALDYHIQKKHSNDNQCSEFLNNNVAF